MRVGAAFLFWREPVLPAEGQRGVDAADAVSGAGIADTARAAAQQQKRQAVRLHIGAARRRLRRVRREPDLRPRKGGKRGLLLAGLGYYREAAECYSRAIAINPFNWEYYRHRAHRFVSCGYFADGAADFTIASRLNPNDWNVWYHLGLSYFLLGMYDKADWAYTRCAALNKTADDICAVTDWHYMTLKRLGKDEEAAKLLDEITEDMPVSDEVANSYYQRLRVYKGLRAPETLFTNAGENAGLDVITQGFGVANYYRMNGQEEKGVEMLKKVVYTAEHSKWYAAFGCLAARVDLKNIGQA